MSYTESRNGDLYCSLCPHTCVIKEGHSGLCGVRYNKNGQLSLPYYGRISGVGLDPIEKKPLYHYYPGEQILSVGFWGCSLQCPFCQNYSISTQVKESGVQRSPKDLVDQALNSKSFGIAYTYSEPLIHFEYILETAKLAKRAGLKNILITNGYLNYNPAIELLEWMDAVNIDLKSFNNDYYKKVLKGSLDPVKDFIKLASCEAHTEITTLVVPDDNDSDKEILEMADFIADIRKDIPWHLSRYFPEYKYTKAATSINKIFELQKMALKKLHFVYAGNVHGREINTYCPDCGLLVIQRTNYQTHVVGLEGSNCNRCNRKILF